MNEIIFLGDSLTAGGDWEAFFPDQTIHNYGVGGDTTADILERLPSLYRHQPKKIFLMIGINDLGNQVPAKEVIENTGIILGHLTNHFPNTEIYLLGLLPVGFKVWKHINMSPLQMNDLNSQIERIAEDYQASFINISPGFADEKGHLKASFTTDGLHLSDKGYKEWAARIRNFVTN